MYKKITQKNKQKARVLLRAFRHFPKYRWNMLWRGNQPGAVLFMLGLTVATLMSFPVIYVVWRSFFAGRDRWLKLLDTRIPSLLWNTLSMAGAVTVAGLGLGLLLAWLAARTDLPGKNFWRWGLAMPLVIPPYVGAVTYIIIFGPRGWIADLTGQPLFNIYSFGGTFFVLTMFTYPYIYLVVSAALKRINVNYEEAALSLGLSTNEVFRSVTLPLLRPAMGAGAILVILYVLSDFGAVAMLRYTTFTAAIYYQMGSFDNLSATILSFVLIMLTAIFIWLEGFTRRKQKYYQTANFLRRPEEIALGRWRYPFLLFTVLVFSFSVLLPIGVILYWTVQGIAGGALEAKFWLYTLNSLKVSALAAIFCMLLALPVIYLKSRHPSVPAAILDKLSYAGYTLPGVIVALGLIFIFNQYIPLLYNTFFLLSIAYMVRFLPLAIQSGQASLGLISPQIDEAARSLGYPPWKVLFKVIFPLILPGVLAGGALVFVSSIKELPATLILRPPGFDTLAVRVWVEASEAVFHMAAPAALVIIIISILPLKWMLSNY